MDTTGKRVTVTVDGFGSKSGIIDNTAFGEHRPRPYHVTFDDGMSGWFDGEQCGLYQWVSAAEASRTPCLGGISFVPPESSVSTENQATQFRMGDGRTGTSAPPLALKFSSGNTVTARR